MNGFYNIFRRGMADGTIPWQAVGTTTGAYLLNNGYVPDFNTHELLGEIDPAFRVAGPVALTGIGVRSDGYCYSDPILFSMTNAPIGVHSFVFVRTAVNPEASTLLFFADDGFGFNEVYVNDEVWVVPDLSFGGFFRP